MKRLFNLIAVAALLGAVALFTGCASTDRPIDPQRVAYAVEDAAFIGSRVALLKNPEWRPAFESAVQALAVLEGKDKIGVADIVAIARTLHVKELKSDEAALVIAGAELLLVNLDRQTIDLNKLAALKPVVSGFRKGLERGLEFRGSALMIEPLGFQPGNPEWVKAKRQHKFVIAEVYGE